MKITEARFDSLIRAFWTVFNTDKIQVEQADSMCLKSARNSDTVRVELSIRCSARTGSAIETKKFVDRLSKVYRLVNTINTMNIILDKKEKDLLDEYDHSDLEKSRGLRSTYIGIVQGAIESETLEWVLRNIICDKNGYEEKKS